MEKKFLCSDARIVKGKVWYIEYKDQAGKRIRVTFGINRIRSLKERRKKAQEIILELSGGSMPKQQLQQPDVKPVAPIIAKPKNIQNATIFEALSMAYNVKSDSDRKHTRKTYRTMYNKLYNFLLSSNQVDLPASRFRIQEAQEYMTFISTGKKLRNTTYNNYLAFAREYWCEMIRQEIITYNPFSKLRLKKPGEKIRKNFNSTERSVIIAYIKEKNYWLFISCLLQYYCFIRPSELLRLKFENFDLGRGIISLKGYQTKNWKDSTITIPDYLLQVLKDPKFLNYHRSWYVFGTKLEPNALKPAKDDIFNKLHKKYIVELKEQGKLQDIRGFTFYSWKDTGCTDAAEFLTPFELRDQLRHSTLEMVMKYYHGKQIIQAVKKHPIRLM